MKKNINMLSKEHTTELENILTGAKAKGKIVDIVKDTGIGAKRKSVMHPANEYDANIQLQSILEEQERYKQLIIKSSTGRRYSSLSRSMAATQSKMKSPNN